MNTVFLFFYEMVLIIIALFALPKAIYSFLFHKKYRRSLLARLGINCPIFDIRNPSIWIHAVSVGETKAVVALAREIKQLFPHHSLIISSVTETGHAEAKKSLPFADYHIYMPLDFKWIIARIVKKASPKLVILCESDFWFNFLYCSKQQGAVLALVNGKMSERSMKRLELFSFFSRKLFNLFDVLCVQNNLYRSRLITAGANLSKVVVTGNLKMDEDYPQLTNQEIIQWRNKLGIDSQQLVLTIGSTHIPEETFFIKMLKEIWKKTPQLRVILVPRRPEHFKEIGYLLEKHQIHWVNFTNISRRTGKEQVILMDAMGLLRMCYQLADLTIVGGSFTHRVGGHNILEPCWYGKPVLFGPYMHTQLELVDLMTQHKAGKQVSPDQLQNVLENWIENQEERQLIGLNGLQLIKNLKGSKQQTLDVLNRHLFHCREQFVVAKT